MKISVLGRANYLYGQIEDLKTFLRDYENYGFIGAEREIELYVRTREVLSDGETMQTNFDRVIGLSSDVLDKIIDVLKKELAKLEEEMEKL